MDVNAMSELIGAGFGLLVTVGFKLIPQLDHWLYYEVPADKRGYVMLGFSALVPLIILAVSCVGLYDLIPCQVAIWKDLLRGWISFLITNQSVFLMTGNSKAKTSMLAEKKAEETQRVIDQVNTQMREGS